MNPFIEFMAGKEMFLSDMEKMTGKEKAKTVELYEWMFNQAIEKVEMSANLSKAREAYCNKEISLYIDKRIAAEVKNYKLDERLLDDINDNRYHFDKALRSLTLTEETDEDILGEITSMYDVCYSHYVLALAAFCCEKKIINETLKENEAKEIFRIFETVNNNKQDGFLIYT